MNDVRVILDFPDRDRLERLEFGTPHRLLTASDLSEVRPTLRAAVQAARDGFWVAGFVAYEAAPAFDGALQVRPPVLPTPLVWFAVCEAPHSGPPPTAGEPPVLTWHADTTRVEYDDAIRTIRSAIAAGDVYQVNYAIRLHAACDADALDWYNALVARRHGRYHAFIETDAWSILSASPELFLDIRERRVTTRPMKGTHRRGRWLEEDAAARAQLAGSAKDRAENLMIVDLLRNDLGRVARFGSVSVPQLYQIETYPSVLQMTSTITAELRDDVALDDVFAATFPCGSITGAPKFTAMRSIAQLEQSPRGPYCGAIGVLRPDGSAIFNVAIRTVVIDRVARRATYGVGGGITWDSHASAEYDEALSKAALLHDRTPSFRLLETMRLERGVVVRAEQHLRRLADSAAYWGFCAEVVTRARAALAHEAASAPPGSWRIRLLADHNGAVEIQRFALPPEPDIVRHVALARAAISRDDPLLYHKTTARAAYETRRADHPAVFDVLLYNEEGLVTEFCNGNIVVELDGALLTPPRDAGLLAGVFRAELLEAGRIQEHTLTLDDVRRAQHIWLINSVREWVECRLTA